jgi:hypothetical protein
MTCRFNLRDIRIAGKLCSQPIRADRLAPLEYGMSTNPPQGQDFPPLLDKRVGLSIHARDVLLEQRVDYAQRGDRAGRQSFEPGTGLKVVLTLPRVPRS